jgi:hypothetical protein
MKSSITLQVRSKKLAVVNAILVHGREKNPSLLTWWICDRQLDGTPYGSIFAARFSSRPITRFKRSKAIKSLSKIWHYLRYLWRRPLALFWISVPIPFVQFLLPTTGSMARSWPGTRQGNSVDRIEKGKKNLPCPATWDLCRNRPFVVHQPGSGLQTASTATALGSWHAWCRHCFPANV